MDGHEAVSEIAKVCRNCAWWVCGYCSCPLLLSAHEARTGERRVNLVKDANDSCTDFVLAYRLTHQEHPGMRPRYRNPSSDVGYTSRNPSKPDILPVLESSDLMAATDLKNVRREEERRRQDGGVL